MIKRLLIAVAILCAVTHAQVPVTPISQPRVTFVNAAGGPCAGCTLQSFAAGTTTPQATYVDSTGTSQNTNPIVLDAAGGAFVWLGANSYKLILKDTSGATIWSVDNVSAGQLLPCSSANAIQSANTAVNGLTCDPTITINTTNHTVNVGTLPAGHVSIGALGTPTSWAFDTTTPASAVASLKAQFTGAYTSSVGVNQFQVLEGGIDPSTAFNLTNGTTAETSSIYGGVVVPASATTAQSSGVMGVAMNGSGLGGHQTNGVGGFFAGICTVGNCQSWGVNSIVVDAPGTFNDLIWGIEDDVNVSSATTHGYGLDLTGFWQVQPTIFLPAIMVHKPISPAGTSYGWTDGLEFEAGAISGEGRAVTLNPVAGGTSQRSQLMRFNSTSSVGGNNAYSIDVDVSGNLNLFPGAGGVDTLNVDSSLGLNFVGTGNIEASHALAPSLATGNTVSHIFGVAETLNNSGSLEFANNGGTGSANNVVALGLFGSGKNLSVDGNGNTVTPGVVGAAGFNSSALAGTGNALACLDASGNLYRGTATTCP